MGHTYLSADVKKSLKRKTAQSIRPHVFGIVTEHLELINSFTKKDYDLYETYHHKWGSPGRKRHVMLDKIVEHEVTGPVKQLAELRMANLYQHQKIIQCIRYRWTNIAQYHKDRINNNVDKFWTAMARRVLRRGKDDPRLSSTAWDGDLGQVRLIKFLKKQYQKQKGLCSISGMLMDLKIGEHVENKCSIDRINSNKGYTIRNIQLTTWWANQMKMDTSMGVFIDRINVLHKVLHA